MLREDRVERTDRAMKECRIIGADDCLHQLVERIIC
jgi:hypothetical protein